MARVKITPILKQAFHEVLEDETLKKDNNTNTEFLLPFCKNHHHDDKEKDEDNDSDDDDEIPFDDLKRFFDIYKARKDTPPTPPPKPTKSTPSKNSKKSQQQQQQHRKKLYLHELLAGSSVIVRKEETVVKPRDPEFEKSINKAKMISANRVYYNLVKGIVPPSSMQKREDTKAFREGLKAAVIPLNILFSVMGVFMFTFFVSRWCQVETSKAFIFGLIAAFSLLILEVVLVILRYKRRHPLYSNSSEDPVTPTFFFQPQYRNARLKKQDEQKQKLHQKQVKQ